jgi:hypothetical protein
MMVLELLGRESSRRVDWEVDGMISSSYTPAELWRWTLAAFSGKEDQVGCDHSLSIRQVD